MVGKEFSEKSGRRHGGPISLSSWGHLRAVTALPSNSVPPPQHGGPSPGLAVGSEGAASSACSCPRLGWEAISPGPRLSTSWWVWVSEVPHPLPTPNPGADTFPPGCWYLGMEAGKGLGAHSPLPPCTAGAGSRTSSQTGFVSHLLLAPLVEKSKLSPWYC